LGLAQQPHSQPGLAGAGFADEQDIVGTAQEVEPGEDLRLADPWLTVDGEGIERPPPRQMRLAEAISGGFRFGDGDHPVSMVTAAARYTPKPMGMRTVDYHSASIRDFPAIEHALRE
jgi:hypothetical protein